MIDQIQFNVANAVDYVQTAKTKTTQAMKYQGKARKVNEFINKFKSNQESQTNGYNIFFLE